MRIGRIERPTTWWPRRIVSWISRTYCYKARLQVGSVEHPFPLHRGCFAPSLPFVDGGTLFHSSAELLGALPQAMDEGASSSSAPSVIDIHNSFKAFLQAKSWPRLRNDERVVHDKWHSARFEDTAQRSPQRQVLLLTKDGRIVLGLHNENNNRVWACSGRGKDGGSDPHRDSWSMYDIVVGEIPGCVEYLETLLGDDGTCGHTPLLISNSAIPARLCFFSQWSDPDRGVKDDIFFIDTKNLCEDCYWKAVPRGFNVWCTSYFDMYNEKVDRDYYRFYQDCYASGNKRPKTYDPNSSSFLRLYWPRCYSAKTRELAFDLESYPRMPGSTVSHECWRWLVWNRAPFYIDQLCVSSPYTVYKDPQQEQQEDRRISKLNAAAYIGAAHGILGVPPGGRGVYTTAELRILGKRALRLPSDFGDPAALRLLGPGYVSLPKPTSPSQEGTEKGRRLSTVIHFGRRRQSSSADPRVSPTTASLPCDTW